MLLRSLLALSKGTLLSILSFSVGAVCVVLSLNFVNDHGSASQAASIQTSRLATVFQDQPRSYAIAHSGAMRSQLKLLRNGGHVVGSKLRLAPLQDNQVKSLIDATERALANNNWAEAVTQFNLLAKRYAAQQAQAAKSNRRNHLLLLFGGLLLILATFIHRLRTEPQLRSDDTADKAIGYKILDAIDDAAILVDSQLQIVHKEDHRLARLFDVESPTDSLLELLEPHIEKATLSDVKHFLTGLLLEPTEDTLSETNPIEKLTLTVTTPTGALNQRFLRSVCTRLTAFDEANPLILITFTDISKSTLMARDMLLLKQSQAEQSKVLISMLHLNGKDLLACAHRVGQLMEDVDTLIATNIDRLRDRNHWVADVTRLAYQVATDTRQFGLTPIEQMWEKYTATLEGFHSEYEINDTKFLEIKQGMAALLPELKLVKSVAPILLSARSKNRVDDEQVHDLRSGFIDRASYQLEDAYASFNESYTVQHKAEELLQVEQNPFAPSILEIPEKLALSAEKAASKLNKKIRFECTGFDRLRVNYPHLEDVTRISQALIANAVEHGIESAPKRIAARKEREGRINADLIQTQKGLELSIRDDGAGLNFAAIFRRAVQLGLLTDEHPKDDRMSLLRCLFEPVYSNGDANHHPSDTESLSLAGLRVVVKSIGGRVSVRSVDGQYCQFRISLPS